MTIIPDIHARIFWKKAVEDAAINEEIIFLGDYLDPYPYEGISTEAAIENFCEIIEFKQKNPGKVTLLLGNHDLMGYHTDKMGYCRTDLQHLDEIRQLFDKNHHLFQVAAIKEAHGKHFVFSHAGIHSKWALHPKVQKTLACDPLDMVSIVRKMNRLWTEKDTRLYDILSIVGTLRGGLEEYGSPVWADMEEWTKNKAEYPGFYQIFGHTQQWEEPVITAYWANLDCRKPFSLSNV